MGAKNGGRAPLAKNDVVTLEITGTTHEGAGVGRFEGMAVFVPAAAQGDTVRARIVKVASSCAFARVEEIIAPAPSRVEPDCAFFGPCGGCVFRHISYEAELTAKQARVSDALRRIAGLSLEPLPILGAKQTDGYRNKAQYPVAQVLDEQGRPAGIRAGFYAPRSHRVVGDGQCRLQPECFARALGAFGQWAAETRVRAYDETTGKGLLRHIYLRFAEGTGQLMACAVANGDALPAPERLVALLRAACPETASVVLNVNRARGNVILGARCVTLWGTDTITDRLCGLLIELSPLSFYQVNRAQAERLYGVAADFAGLTGRELLLDLYCGAGAIGLSMAGRAGRVVGVEVVPEAVENARRNAHRNGIRNAEFLCDAAGGAAKRLAAQGLRPDVVVVDPPRKGCDEPTIEAIAEMSPARVVYVSCDPATLARDLALLTARGYRARQAQPVDLFPRTAHVETVVRLEKPGGKQ